jgi:hypothetical protein
MSTPTTRQQHNVRTERYQTDVTDEEWRISSPIYRGRIAPDARGLADAPDHQWHLLRDCGLAVSMGCV